MYTLTRGPVPEKVAFTIRVDSAAHPELANFLHHLPYGARSTVVAELLALGLAAKQAGATLAPASTAAPAPKAPKERRRRKPAVVPVLGVVFPPAATAVPGSVATHLSQPATPAPGTAPTPAPASHPLAASPAVSPPLAAAAPAPTPPDQVDPVGQSPTGEEPAPSAVSQLLGQFDD